MRTMIGKAEIGERGMLYFHKEDKWIYPSVSFDASNSESASINLQHMSIKSIHKLADEIKRIAFLLESKEALKGNNSKNVSMF